MLELWLSEFSEISTGMLDFAFARVAWPLSLVNEDDLSFVRGFLPNFAFLPNFLLSEFSEFSTEKVVFLFVLERLDWLLSLVSDDDLCLVRGFLPNFTFLPDFLLSEFSGDSIENGFDSDVILEAAVNASASFVSEDDLRFVSCFPFLFALE